MWNFDEKNAKKIDNKQNYFKNKASWFTDDSSINYKLRFAIVIKSNKDRKILNKKVSIKNVQILFTKKNQNVNKCPSLTSISTKRHLFYY